MTYPLNPNRTYTRKTYRGQLISDSRFSDSIEQNQEQLREKLPQACKGLGIELDLMEPRQLTFPPESDGEIIRQIRSDFYLTGNYPENYFYQVNRVQSQCLRRIS